MSIGWNTNKTHTLANKWGYIDAAQHSELVCLRNYKGEMSSKIVVVNLRPSGHNSKPCKRCQKMLRAHGLKRVTLCFI